MKKALYTIIVILFSICSYAQQIGYESQISETRPFWNPATTAPTTVMSVDAFFRQQWLGFSGAPQTGYASLYYPMIDMNMSIGGLVYNDKAGPVSKTGLKLNYAYRLREFMSREGILSIGLSANFEQFRYDGSSEIFIDAGDELILSGNSSTFFPSVGAGIYFNSNPIDFDRGNNSFYVGFAFNNAYTTNVLVDSSDFERKRHFNFILGSKIMNYESYIEPSISVNFVKPDLIDFVLSLKYEKENAFWAGAGYSSISDFAIQGGFIMDRFLDNRYAKLRVGALANIMLTEYSSNLGPGFEVFIRYEIDLD